MHRWRKLGDGSEVRITGTDNKTFPFPLKRNGSEQWYFDTAAARRFLHVGSAVGTHLNVNVDTKKDRLELSLTQTWPNRGPPSVVLAAFVVPLQALASERARNIRTE